MENEPKPYLLLGETIETWHQHAIGDPISDEYDPDAIVPCSRYGRTASEVAWYAVGGLIAYEEAAGIENQVEAIMLLDELMNFVVNDHPSIADLICQTWNAIPPELREHYGSYEDVRGMADY